MIAILNQPSAFLLVQQIPGISMVESAGRLEVTGDDAAVTALAAAQGWSVEPARGSVSYLWAVLSPAQRALPLDEQVWDTLRGVAERLTFDGEYCTRRVYYRADDIGGKPLIDVRYRYLIKSGRIVADTSTITYPYTDGGALVVEGQVYVRDQAAWPVDGRTPPDGWLSWG